MWAFWPGTYWYLFICTTYTYLILQILFTNIVGYCFQTKLWSNIRLCSPRSSLRYDCSLVWLFLYNMYCQKFYFKWNKRLFDFVISDWYKEVFTYVLDSLIFSFLTKRIIIRLAMLDSNPCIYTIIFHRYNSNSCVTFLTCLVSYILCQVCTVKIRKKVNLKEKGIS